MASGSDKVVLKTFPVKAKQGVAVDQKHFYAISNASAVKCDIQSGKPAAQWDKTRKQAACQYFTQMNRGTVLAE